MRQRASAQSASGPVSHLAGSAQRVCVVPLGPQPRPQVGRAPGHVAAPTGHRARPGARVGLQLAGRQRHQVRLHAEIQLGTLGAGIRQRTGTLLAAQALVASFLGGSAIREGGFGAWEWLAISALVVGLVISAVVLAPWKLKFAGDARDLYKELYQQASEETDDETLAWLAAAGFGYQDLRVENAPKVRTMARLSGALGVLMVAQTLLWLTALGVD